MEKSALIDLFFIGEKDTVTEFVNNLHLRCIKPSEYVINVNDFPMKTVFDSNDETYIGQNMVRYKKDKWLNRLVPADSFVTVRISDSEILYQEPRNGGTRRRRITTEEISQEALDTNECFVKDYMSTEEDPRYLYVENPDTVLIAGKPGYGIYRDDFRYDGILTQNVLNEAALTYLKENPDSIIVPLNVHDTSTEPAYIIDENDEVSGVKRVFRRFRQTYYEYFVPVCYYRTHSENFETCEECGRTFFAWDHALENGKCWSCRSFQIYGYHSWPGTFETRMADGEADQKRFFGIEIETEGDNEDDTNIVASMSDIFHLETDGSLGDSMHPFEMISQPLSWKAWLENEARLREMFKALQDSGRQSHDTLTCGFHIHVSADAFDSTENAKRAGAIIMGLKDEVMKIGRRNGGSYSSYININNLINEQDMQMVSNCRGHNTAINLGDLGDRRTNTMEFRFPKGTLNVDTVLGTLQFIDNIITAANSHKERITFGDLCHGEYIEKYINERHTKYRVVFNMDAYVDFTKLDIDRITNLYLDGRITAEETLARIRNYLIPAEEQPVDVTPVRSINTADNAADSFAIA